MTSLIKQLLHSPLLDISLIVADLAIRPSLGYLLSHPTRAHGMTIQYSHRTRWEECVGRVRDPAMA